MPSERPNWQPPATVPLETRDGCPTFCSGIPKAREPTPLSQEESPSCRPYGTAKAVSPHTRSRHPSARIPPIARGHPVSFSRRGTDPSAESRKDQSLKPQRGRWGQGPDKDRSRGSVSFRYEDASRISDWNPSPEPGLPSSSRTRYRLRPLFHRRILDQGRSTHPRPSARTSPPGRPRLPEPRREDTFNRRPAPCCQDTGKSSTYR